MIELICLLLTLGLGVYASCIAGPYKESKQKRIERENREEQDRIKAERELLSELPDDFYGPKW